MGVVIKIDKAVKKYGENTVIKDLDLEIKPGEFFTLLGPSGCGKTTLLRMIAGFNSIEGGTFRFDDKIINDLDPGKRNIGMVFQNYAIFPHLTVKKNVAFGLTNQKIPKEEIEQRTERAMELMQIKEYADRLPERLSGGQQQRVALARALVLEPGVLLMDEPLSNLDAKLRVEMRTAIKNIQNRIGITTVYVTHDQEEAMAVSDRIAVMNGGVIQHVGKPKDLYQRPANLFVATFIGRSNLLEAELDASDSSFVFKNGFRLKMDNIREDSLKNQKIIVSARPEELQLCQDLSVPGIKATVNDCVFLGLNTHYFVTLETGEDAEIIQESTIDSIIPAGSTINLTINHVKVNAFTEDGSKNIVKGVNDDNAPKA